MRLSIRRLAINFAFPVIAPAEILFEPYVKAGKKISAAHFSNRELCFSRAAVAPSDRNHRPRITTHDRFKRQFHREIEMRRNQRTAAIDYSFLVGFESVGRVVEAYAKEHLYEIVGQSVEKQFHFG